MKKIFYKIILIISFIPYILILFGILRSFLFGIKIEMLSGLDIPLKYGVEGVLNYLWYTCSLNCFGIITIPLFLICLVYQLLYFKKLNKNN